MASQSERIIVLVDMDCFYVQVEQKLCPEYLNKPCAVVQYKQYQGGGIIAVNYEARAKGVTRMLRGNEALKKCPDIHLFRVPEVRGKADLSRYREAGTQVINVLCEFSDCVERASIDEAYLDMTSIISSRIDNSPPVTVDQLSNTFVIGWEGENPESRKIELKKWLDMIYEEDHLFNERMLALTAVIVEEMRTAVYEKTGYRCSAGIAHNKMLSKLSCGIHKPNKQTVLPLSSMQLLYSTIPIKKVRNLGGKLGDEIVKAFNIEKMSELAQLTKSQLIGQFGDKTGQWLYGLGKGFDNEPVTARQLPKSIGCGKNFPGKAALSTKDEVTHWLKQLALELEERLLKDQDANKRVARLLTVSIRIRENNNYSAFSKSCPIYVYKAERLAKDAFLAISKFNTASDSTWKPAIFTLSMAAGKFDDKLDGSHCDIQSFFTSSKTNDKDDSGLKDVTLNSLCDSVNDSKKVADRTLNNIGSNPNSKSSKGIASFFKSKIRNSSEIPAYNCSDETRIDAASADISVCENLLENNLNSFNSVGNVSCEDNYTVDIHQNDQACKDSKISDNEQNDESGENLIDLPQNLNPTNLSDSEMIKPSSIENMEKSLDLSSPSKGFFARKLAEHSTLKPNESQSKCETSNSELNNDKCNVSENPSTSDKSVVLDNDYSDIDPELTKLCEKCHKHIPIWEEDEHLDYHIALDLSKEFSLASNIHNNTSVTKNVPLKSKVNRKRGKASKAGQSKKRVVQSNTLDSFFK